MTFDPRTIVGFVLLWVAYEAPEAVGQRLLDSFVWQSALLLGFFVVAYAVGRWRARLTADPYALAPVADTWSVAIDLLIATVCARLLALIVGVHFGVYEGAFTIAGTPATAAARVATAVPMTFLPSFAADLLTRGYVFRARRWRALPFVIASALIFTGSSVFRLALGPSEWLMLFVFGAIYAFAVIRTGSLWPAVALHWGWNFANSSVDALWSIEIVSPIAARFLSIGAHLLLAVVVLLLTEKVWRRRRRGVVLP